MAGRPGARKDSAPAKQAEAKEEPFRDLGEATYRVTLPVFEGPLDLLLHLVQKHELAITDLPVSFITEKYLEYISMMRVLQIDIASEYLVMAATLVHLKSKTLLPPDPKQDAEDGIEGEELDPREELIRRLLEYQKYKDAGEQLGSRDVAGRDVFVRPPMPVTSTEDGPLAEFSVFKLIEAFQSVLSKAKVKVQHEVTADRITITERIHELVEVMRYRPKVLFEEIFEGATTRFDYVITFLALLEMTRLRMTRFYQSEPYAPIHIELSVTDEDALAEAKARLPQS
ncbi:MAG: segregation and condensation protein A [Polyangiales bacterium]